MANAEILRKLTLKTAGLTVEAIKTALVSGTDAEGKDTHYAQVSLLKIAGIVTSAKPGSTDKGEYLKLVGQFTAINQVTGETFTSAQCILPDFVTAPLGSALQSGSSEVQFAVEVIAKHAPTSVTGYQFGVKPLIEAKPSDAMQALLGVAGISSAPALAAPEQDGDEPTANATTEAKSESKGKSKK